MSSCNFSHENKNEPRSIDIQENLKDLKAGPSSEFPIVGFRKVYEKIIPFPIERVYPMFEPQGRVLLYDNWEPSVLKKGEEESLIGQIEFSKYDELDVLLKVTDHNPSIGYIQYLVIWDNFEFQRIDIFCEQGIKSNTTHLKWVEHNAGLYKKGVSLVTKFVEEGYLVEAIERYTDNIELRLNQAQ